MGRRLRGIFVLYLPFIPSGSPTEEEDKDRIVNGVDKHETHFVDAG